MFGSHRASSALAALVLTACAHGGGGAGSSVYGGRAAQPFGWPEQLLEDAQ